MCLVHSSCTRVGTALMLHSPSLSLVHPRPGHCCSLARLVSEATLTQHEAVSGAGTAQGGGCPSVLQDSLLMLASLQHGGASSTCRNRQASESTRLWCRTLSPQACVPNLRRYLRGNGFSSVEEGMLCAVRQNASLVHAESQAISRSAVAWRSAAGRQLGLAALSLG